MMRDGVKRWKKGEEEKNLGKNEGGAKVAGDEVDSTRVGGRPVQKCGVIFN